MLIVNLLYLFLLKIVKITQVSIPKLLVQNLIFFLLVQMFVLVESPIHSLVPEQLLLKSGLLRSVDSVTSTCNEPEEIKIATKFVEPSIDTSQVKFYYGGSTVFTKYFGKLFPKIAASTVNNYIYISPEEDCVRSEVIVHEFVHVWQYQHKIGSGPHGLIIVFQYIYLYLKDFNSLYDYGGVEGLAKAKIENKTFRDFGIEQQAMIVENYYFFLDWSKRPGFTDLRDSEEFNLLKYFVDQEFVFNSI